MQVEELLDLEAVVLDRLDRPGQAGVQSAQPAPREQLVQLDLREFRVILELPDRLARQDLREFRVILELPDRLEIRVLRVTPAPLDRLATQDLKEFRVSQAPLDRLESRVLRAKAPQEQLVPPESRGRLVRDLVETS
jgi:hypothetical protein